MLNYIESLTFDDLMLIPKYSTIRSRSEVDLSITLCKGFKFSSAIVPSNMKTITELAMANLMYKYKSLAVLHRFIDFENQLKWIEEIKTWGDDALNFVGVSIGVKDEDKDKVKQFIKAGVKIICIDIAHGDSEHCLQMTKWIATTYPKVLLISGNAAMGDGASRIWEAGADICKVGVGQGCFGAGTRILMGNGIYKNIENVLPGDFVINKDGKAVRVLKAFCTGEKQVAKLRNNIFYEDTYLTPDHQMWVGDLNNYSRPLWDIGRASTLDKKDKIKGKPSKYKWKPVSEMQKDVLLVPNKINFHLPETFNIDLKKRCGGNYRWETDTTEYEIDYTLQPSYELGYLFGTFLGDGCALSTSHNNSHIGNVSWYYGLNETDIAHKTIDCIKKIFTKNNVSCETTNNMNIVRLYYKPMADYLNQWGKKSNKSFPAELLVNDTKYLQGLFDGLYDSDGNNDNGRVSFTNTSVNLIELFNILTVILTSVFPSNCKRKITSGGLKECDIDNCKQPYSSRINKLNNRLTQNYQVVEKLEYTLTDKIISVYDLEVDCPTHSFIANNMIVHNSICLTRINTGNGVPAITTLSDCYDAKKYTEAKLGRKLFIMNDGGTKSPGDIVKALCFADLCMAGNLFASSSETPGDVIKEVDGNLYKSYVGSSTHRGTYSEGVEAVVRYKGETSQIVQNIAEGIRSGLSYQGVYNLEDLKKNPRFVKMTVAGLKESHAHDVQVIK